MAVHPDAGEHLAGLDVLPPCSWVPHVSVPMSVILFCMSFSAESDLVGLYFHISQVKGFLVHSFFSCEAYFIWGGNLGECPEDRLCEVLFRVSLNGSCQTLTCRGQSSQRALVLEAGERVLGLYGFEGLC